MSKYKERALAEAKRVGVPNPEKLSLSELVSQIKDRGGSMDIKTGPAKVEATKVEPVKADTSKPVEAVAAVTTTTPAAATKTETHVGAPVFNVTMPALPVPAQPQMSNVHLNAGRGWRDDFSAVAWWFQAAMVGAFAMMVLSKITERF